MKEEFSSYIDFYLETEKVNPFFMHLGANASSRQLILLRNNAYTLNKLTLINLQNPEPNHSSDCFSKEILQLYRINIQAIISNPMMPFKDFLSVKDLISRIQYYYYQIQKLTTKEIYSKKQDKFTKRNSIQLLWPQIRLMILGIEEKIPKSHQYIKQYVAIRRGLLQSNKKYFVDQMMGKKIVTKELRQLVEAYQKSKGLDVEEIGKQMEEEERLDWKAMKKRVRAMALQDREQDWILMCAYFESKQFNILEQKDKTSALQYTKDVLGTFLEEKRKDLLLGQMSQKMKDAVQKLAKLLNK